MLTEQMIRLISTYTIGCVATARSNGAPAVSPKATFLVIDSSTIAFANIRSEGTVENLRHDPRVEIDFIDPFKRLGCRVCGTARYTPLGNVSSAAGSRFREEWPDLYDLIRGIVTIDVSHAEILTSPSYDLGADPDQLSEQWLTRYASALGFTVTKASGLASLSAGQMGGAD